MKGRTSEPGGPEGTWNSFVAQHVLPAFRELQSTSMGLDGTTIDIQQAPAGECWISLTWKVAPSASTLELLPPSMRSVSPPKTVLVFTVISDQPTASATTWCETRVPDKEGVFRHDYHREDLTKEEIINAFLASYQRHVLGQGR